VTVQEKAAGGCQARATAQTTSHYPKFADNSAKAQRMRMADCLRIGPVTTLAARSKLDILHPAGRVLEMRKAGWNIVTEWVLEPTDCGKLHRVAKYVLLAEGGAL
jgi:Helix-turn-helix domain